MKKDMIKRNTELIQELLLIFTHAILYSITISLLVIFICSITGFNPIKYYSDAKWIDVTETDSNEAASGFEQTNSEFITDFSLIKNGMDAGFSNGQLVISQINASIAYLSARTEGQQYATLYIDRIGMEVPIYFGDDSATLRKGPGQYAGSALPGEGSQILIAGHNTTHFSALQNVIEGDIIRVVTGYGEFNYQVVSTKIVHMSDTSSYNLSLDHEQLALYTCYPFSGPPGKTHRYFVYADLM